MQANPIMGLRLVAILRGIKPNEAADIGQALVDAGIRAIEVPLNSPHPMHSIESLSHLFGDKVLIGAGTVLTAPDVKEVASAGGKLVVSPNTDEAVIRKSKELGLVSVPGFATATEAFTAIAAGADALKLFPAGTQGASNVKALKAVLPNDMPLLAVGGVGTSNMREFATAGADGFGLGSNLYRPGDTAPEVGRRAAEFVSQVNDLYG